MNAARRVPIDDAPLLEAERLALQVAGDHAAAAVEQDDVVGVARGEVDVVQHQHAAAPGAVLAHQALEQVERGDLVVQVEQIWVPGAASHPQTGPDRSVSAAASVGQWCTAPASSRAGTWQRSQRVVTQGVDSIVMSGSGVGQQVDEGGDECGVLVRDGVGAAVQSRPAGAGPGPLVWGEPAHHRVMQRTVQCSCCPASDGGLGAHAATRRLLVIRATRSRRSARPQEISMLLRHAPVRASISSHVAP